MADILITQTELFASGNYIDLGSAAHHPAVGPQTIMAYVLPTAYQNNFNYLYSRVSGASWLRFLGLSTGNKVGFGVNSGKEIYPYVDAPGYVLNSWSNYAVTWDGTAGMTGIALYKDGAALSIPTQAGDGTAPVAAITGNVILGNRMTDKARATIGSIAYIATWGRVLSAAEIQTAYTSGPLSVPDGLTLCWANGQDYSQYGVVPVARSAYASGAMPASGLNLGPALGAPIPDTTPPVLTAATATAVSGQQISVSVSTDTAEGTLYRLVSTNATESAATVEAGTSTTVTASGVQSFTHTIPYDTLSYVHFLHRDAAGNASAVVSSAGIIISAAPPLPEMTIVLSEDGMNIKPSGTSIVGATTATPQVTLASRSQTTSWMTRWLQAYFKLTNAKDKRPSFRIDNPTFTPPDDAFPTGWKSWYSYDGITWQRFGAGGVLNGANWEFQNDAPFTQDDVYISVKTPKYPMWRIAALVNDLRSSFPQYVYNLQSSPSGTYGAAFTPQTNDVGQNVPSQPLYAFGITDSTVSPVDGRGKRLLVLTNGIHAGEDECSWAFEGAVRFALSNHADAVELRRNYRILCYACVNPMGLYGGHYRGQWESGSKLTLDTNRDYPSDNSASQLQSSQYLRAALDADTAGQSVFAALDFHSLAGKATTAMIYYRTAVNPQYTEFLTRFRAYNSAYWSQESTLDTTLTDYVGRHHGSEHSYTLEICKNTLWPSMADIERVGEHAIRAFGGVLASGLVPTHDRTGQAHLTHSHVLSAQGAKGILATASLSHSHALSATGTALAGAVMGAAHVTHVHGLNIVGAKNASGVVALAHSHSLLSSGESSVWTIADSEISRVAVYVLSAKQRSVRWAAKDPREEFAVQFDFSACLETVTVQAVVVEVISGADESPDTLLNGPPHAVGPRVRQRLHGGVDGCGYLITAIASDGTQTYVLAATLPVKKAR